MVIRTIVKVCNSRTISPVHLEEALKFESPDRSESESSNNSNNHNPSKAKKAPKRPNINAHKSYHAFRTRQPENDALLVGDVQIPRLNVDSPEIKIPARSPRGDFIPQTAREDSVLEVFDAVAHVRMQQYEVFHLIFPNAVNSYCSATGEDETIFFIGDDPALKLFYFIGNEHTFADPASFGLVVRFYCSIHDAMKVDQLSGSLLDCKVSCSIKLLSNDGQDRYLPLPAGLEVIERVLKSSSAESPSTCCNDIDLESKQDLLEILSELFDYPQFDSFHVCIEFYCCSGENKRTFRFVQLLPSIRSDIRQLPVSEFNDLAASRSFFGHWEGPTGDDNSKLCRLNDIFAKCAMPDAKVTVLALVPDENMTTSPAFQLILALKQPARVVVTDISVASNSDDAEIADEPAIVPSTDEETPDPGYDIYYSSNKLEESIVETLSPMTLGLDYDRKGAVTFSLENDNEIPPAYEIPFSMTSVEIGSSEFSPAANVPVMMSPGVAKITDLFHAADAAAQDFKTILEDNLKEILAAEKLTERCQEAESKLASVKANNAELSLLLGRARHELHLVKEVWRRGDSMVPLSGDLQHSMSSLGSVHSPRSDAIASPRLMGDLTTTLPLEKRMAYQRPDSLENELNFHVITNVDELNIMPEAPLTSPNVLVSEPTKAAPPRVITHEYSMDDDAGPAPLATASEDEDDVVFSIDQPLQSFFNPMRSSRGNLVGGSTTHSIPSMLAGGHGASAYSSTTWELDRSPNDKAVAAHVSLLKVNYEVVYQRVNNQLEVFQAIKNEFASLSELNDIVSANKFSSDERKEELKIADIVEYVQSLLEENKRLKTEKERSEKLLAVLAQTESFRFRGPRVASNGQSQSPPSKRKQNTPQPNGIHHTWTTTLFGLKDETEVKYVYLDDEEKERQAATEMLVREEFDFDQSDDENEFDIDDIQMVNGVDSFSSDNSTPIVRSRLQSPRREEKATEKFTESPGSMIGTETPASKADVGSLFSLNLSGISWTGLVIEPGEGLPAMVAPQDQAQEGNFVSAALATMQYTISWIPGLKPQSN